MYWVKGTAYNSIAMLFLLIFLVFLKTWWSVGGASVYQDIDMSWQ